MELNLDKLVRLNAQSDGRDKIARQIFQISSTLSAVSDYFVRFYHYRLVQYACRALWDSMQARPWNSALIDKLKTLEYLLSSFRKCKNQCMPLP